MPKRKVDPLDREHFILDRLIEGEETAYSIRQSFEKDKPNYKIVSDKLQLLERSGRVVSKQDDKGRRKRTYRITASGLHYYYWRWVAKDWPQKKAPGPSWVISMLEYRGIEPKLESLRSKIAPDVKKTLVESVRDDLKQTQEIVSYLKKWIDEIDDIGAQTAVREK